MTMKTTAEEILKDTLGELRYSLIGIELTKQIIHAMEMYLLQSSHPTIPSDEEIEIHYPCELGQEVRMEENYSYGEIIKANYHRRQGAKWMRSICQAKLAESEREMKEFRQLARLISALNEDHENFKCIAGHIQLARKLLTTTTP